MESGSKMFFNAIALLILMIILILLFFWVKSTGGLDLLDTGFRMMLAPNTTG